MEPRKPPSQLAWLLALCLSITSAVVMSRYHYLNTHIEPEPVQQQKSASSWLREGTERFLEPYRLASAQREAEKAREKEREREMQRGLTQTTLHHHLLPLLPAHPSTAGLALATTTYTLSTLYLYRYRALHAPHPLRYHQRQYQAPLTAAILLVTSLAVLAIQGPDVGTLVFDALPAALLGALGAGWGAKRVAGWWGSRREGSGAGAGAGGGGIETGLGIGMAGKEGRWVPDERLEMIEEA